jgi:hypothetical protein
MVAFIYVMKFQANSVFGVETNSELLFLLTSVFIIHRFITLFFQRFTVRNVTVNNAQTGVFSPWNWGEVLHIYIDHSEILISSRRLDLSRNYI